jgi:hypothetical protein
MNLLLICYVDYGINVMIISLLNVASHHLLISTDCKNNYGTFMKT